MRLSSVLAIGLLCGVAFTSASADLTSDIQQALSTKTAAKGQIGVEVVKIGSDTANSKIEFQSNSHMPMIPASNMKLLTTSTALDKLGGDFKFTTKLLLKDDQLIVVGDGDPTIGDVELLRKSGWTTTTLFENWANLLKSRGINRVGQIVVDDSVFDDQLVAFSWPKDQIQKRYVAQVCGLNLNANCLDFYLRPTERNSAVQFRIEPPTDYASVSNTCVYGQRNAIWLSRVDGGNQIVLKGETNAANEEPVSVTVNDPALFFGHVLSETFQNAGISVGGKVERDRSAHTWSDATLLAQHETPIEIVVRRANKDSMNLYAECLMKRLGAQRKGGLDGSWQTGMNAVEEFLRSRGVDEKEITILDGSGLSKENRVSAHAITTVLVADYFGPNRKIFMESLAVGGVDGTLDSRFGGDLRGRVFAKTGYVSNARCLSGFVKTKKDNLYAFSILINGPTGSEGKRIHEAIVTAIDKND